ncbi:hypothetical protein BJB45_02445 [Halomonas huangheensis]|uniref:Uncharacterized protein n=1 Tax=Halomonas huangheensis TaxID=1178482 RepID=W1N4A7_9GAMM|nr:hypothetical protein AR456_03940 [Halomonas huangheensis]ERL50006.1 hypothetical protein BJB45_02445 [Halomonas huangheensis]
MIRCAVVSLHTLVLHSAPVITGAVAFLPPLMLRQRIATFDFLSLAPTYIVMGTPSTANDVKV